MTLLQCGNAGFTPCVYECLAMISLLTIGGESHSWHGVHTGLSNVLKVHRDVPEKGTKHCEYRTLEDGLNSG